MVFSSYSFLFYFLPILILIYYRVSERFHNILLLVFSLAFYAWGGPEYLLVMFLSILVNYIMGLVVFTVREKHFKLKIALCVTVLLNLLLLGYFKYFDFFIENINFIFCTEFTKLDIVLPIGISFYTFQGLSYVIDVKNGKGEVQRNPLKVALYISFFPQLIAGPIVRYETVASELECRHADRNDMSYGMGRFVVGLAKKILLANEFGQIADQYFALKAGELSIVTAWIGAVAYTLQIYYDFSGYSDMAIGLGRIFGFHFPENFNYPYISKSVTDFWRRWHISLSTWFRDYVYIPLGGNRCSGGRHIFNIFFVWTLTGIWHGASWNFLIWGMYYAFLLILEKVFLVKYADRLPDFLKGVMTMLLVTVGWVIFRADTLSHACTVLKSMFDIHTNSHLFVRQTVRFCQDSGLWFLGGVLFAIPLAEKVKTFAKRYLSVQWRKALHLVGFVFLFALCVIKLVVSSYNPFIYFRF